MSILIKDMEIPKRCDECQMLEGSADDGLCHAAHRWLDDDCFSWYQYPEGDVDTSKPMNCPLIEVKGGRLFGLFNGVLYEANTKAPVGKVIEIPQIKFNDEVN